MRLAGGRVGSAERPSGVPRGIQWRQRAEEEEMTSLVGRPMILLHFPRCSVGRCADPRQSCHDSLDIWLELPPTPRVGVDLTEMSQNN